MLATPGLAAEPPRAKPTLLLTHPILGAPGKEAMLLQVDLPPGSADPVHRHDALVYVYVLEGSVVMQLRGKPEVTLKAGDIFYEVPGDIHVVGRNASQSEPARFLAFFVKKQGVMPVMPAE
jgi:quercetin dioxygenase-like cupin family protein